MLTHERICCSYWKICSQRGDAAVAPPSRTWQYAVDSAPMIRIPYYPKPLNPVSPPSRTWHVQLTVYPMLRILYGIRLKEEEDTIEKQGKP